jgi:putative DNA primase/helicase
VTDTNDYLRKNGPEKTRTWIEARALKPDLKVVNGSASPLPPKTTLECIRASDVVMEAIEWIWADRFGYGKLGLLGGLPDMGKGLIAAFIIACVTKGTKYPCDEGAPPRTGSVIYLSAEDAPGDTICPRLAAAGADLTKVHIVKCTRVAGGKNKTFSLITDLDALKDLIERLGDAAMIVIDPVASYVGGSKLNKHMASDVRTFLTPVTDMAADKHIFILGVVHFNKKTDVNSAMLRISDSLAYVAAARHVYVVVNDPEVDGQRIFVKAKNNLSPDSKALSYITQAVKVGHDEKLHKDIWAPRVVWGSQHVKVTANEAMANESAGGHNKHAKKGAHDFLLERLANGPVKVAELREDCKANDIAWRTAERVKTDLKIASRKDKTKLDGEWFWELPPKAAIPGWE